MKRDDTLDLADIVRSFGDDYLARFGDVMLPSQRKTLFDIAACMTSKLGGRRLRCATCDHSFWVYHACRNRSCPKCHGGQIAAWLADREIEILRCPYFHLTATVPEELRPAFLRHQKYCYGLLMRIVSLSVIDIAREPRFVGATPAVMTVLHTWNARMQYHPHVHLLVSAGGVSDDGATWRDANASFLIPVRRLSKTIARRMREALRKERPELLATIPKRAWSQSWCSFCLPYGTGNKAVLNYLGRYVFRIAITNHRIVALTETGVTFRYKDRKANVMKLETVDGVGFLRRFLMHVLPKGFHKVRYYGLWNPGKRNMQIAAKLLLILRTTPQKTRLLTTELPSTCDDRLVEKRFGECCPKCGGDHLTILVETRREFVPFSVHRLANAGRGHPQ